MKDETTKDAVVEELDRLAEADRRRVLDYARSLGSRVPKGVAGDSLLALAGSLPEADASAMEAAIEDGCERVNLGAW
jgi:hypothetical protein